MHFVEPIHFQYPLGHLICSPIITHKHHFQSLNIMFNYYIYYVYYETTYIYKYSNYHTSKTSYKYPAESMYKKIELKLISELKPFMRNEYLDEKSLSKQAIVKNRETPMLKFFCRYPQKSLFSFIVNQHPMSKAL